MTHERELALQRVLQSKTFATGETMRQILKFVVEKSLAERANEIKEYTIATEALGRSPDFNSKEDNIVRVQVNRLRKKLDEYYGDEGAQDPLRISIPLGHYYPDYLAAPPDEQQAEQQAQPVVSPEPAERQSLAPAPARTGLPRAINWQWLALGLLVLNLGLGSYLLWRSRANAGSSKTTAPLAKSLAALWQPFIATDQPPLIVYSNAFFLMSEQGDLYRYYAGTSHALAMGAQVPSLAGLERRGPVPGGVGPLYYFDSYTGIGEVVAAGRLAQLLARGGQDFLVKRSRITSYEDIRNRQVIFLGASLEDALLGKLPVESELVFEEPTGNEFVGRLLIRDRHPADGKPATYEFQRDTKTKALLSEYALISLLPGITPGQHILVLAGLSTLGTQAAAEYATSEASLQRLEKLWAPTVDKDLPPYFQALLEVQIRDGIAVKTDCLLIRWLHRTQ